MSHWTCDKCKKSFDRTDLSEIFAWGLYVCSPCIKEWIYDDEKTDHHRTDMKMKEIPHKIGNIYQLNPSKAERWGGQYLVATDIYEWGVMGYLLLDRPDEGTLVRFKGLAYLRPKYEQIQLVGFAEWIIRDDEDA